MALSPLPERILVKPNAGAHRPERATRAPVRCSGLFDGRIPYRPSWTYRRCRDLVTSAPQHVRNPVASQNSPSHSMTWSARASTDGGMASPSACAVRRLMTNSNFVGCSMGRSAGLAPLRILST